MKKICIISVPFSIISIPSFEIASMKSYFMQQGISVRVKHLHIEFAEQIGGDCYRFLRTTDIGQGLFASLLHREQYEAIKNEYKEMMEQQEYDYDTIRKKTFEIVMQQIEKLQIEKDEIILFYLYSQQLLPTLFYAKNIKKKFANQIWLAGYHCGERIGDSIRKCYPFIEKTIANDVEESIACFVQKKMLEKCEETLDFLPTPDYSDFDIEVRKRSDDFQKNIVQTPYYQVEYARGCWWNQCSFCTLNCKNPTFRERSLPNILQDYEKLIKQHNTLKILVNQFVNNKNWQDIIKALLKKYPGMYGSIDLNFKVSSIKEYDDFLLLARTGTSILVGTENFSSFYLEKMKKGQTVIDNIQFLKWAERSRTACYHNMMYGMPYETEEHYLENEKVIDLICHLPPPFDDEAFRLTYQSDIFENPDKYEIKKIMWRKGKEELWFPAEIKEHLIPFFYDFESKHAGLQERKEKWISLLESWRRRYYQYAKNATPKQVSMLSMRYAEDILHIFDERYDNVKSYVLKDIEKVIYEYCDEKRAFQEICEAFKEIEEEKIMMVLKRFCEEKIMYCERDFYLSLAI